jgi:hypothetical protein
VSNMNREANCGNGDVQRNRSLAESTLRKSSNDKSGYIFWIKNGEGLPPIEHLRPIAILPSGQHAQVKFMLTPTCTNIESLYRITQMRFIELLKG